MPREQLAGDVREWADDMLALSPTALRFLKQSFNADTEHIAGIGQLAFTGLGLFLDTDEAREGVNAFTEKREPDFDTPPHADLAVRPRPPELRAFDRCADGCPPPQFVFVNTAKAA